MLFAKGNPFDVIHRCVIITYATNKFISIPSFRLRIIKTSFMEAILLLEENK